MFDAFLLIGFILFFGYIAGKLSEKHKISEVLPLVFLGVLIGPLLGIIDPQTQSAFVGASNFVGALALIILLFDGGIKLDVFNIIGALPKSTIFTLAAFVFSAGGTAGLSVLILGWEPLGAILLGVTIGGTSAAIVLAMIENSQANEETKNVLTLESTITDVLCILSAFIILKIMQSGAQVEFGSVLNLFASSFSIAILIGILGAAGWLVFLRKLIAGGEPDYILTIAAVSMIYGITEAAGGNGAISVFVFGLVLGNAQNVAERFGMDLGPSRLAGIRFVQGEITFFVRTFFFVYMGLLFSSELLDPMVMLIVCAIYSVILVGRYLAARTIFGKQNSDNMLIITTSPRGLAAAVLATLPLKFGLALPLFYPITVGVILLSNIVGTIGLYRYEKSNPLPLEAPLPEDTAAGKDIGKLRPSKVKRVK